MKKKYEAPSLNIYPCHVEDSFMAGTDISKVTDIVITNSNNDGTNTTDAGSTFYDATKKRSGFGSPLWEE